MQVSKRQKLVIWRPTSDGNFVLLKPTLAFAYSIQKWFSFCTVKKFERLHVRPKLIAKPRSLWLLTYIFAFSFAVCGPLQRVNAQTNKPKWKSNATLSNIQKFTVPEVGACQGVAIVNNKLYFYGDRYDVSPRQGIIKEYTLDMKPTGRQLWLNQNKMPRLTHPTGIAYLDKNNVFIGNTFKQQGTIFLIDWELAWQDGNLDRAIKHKVSDDKMINGCRPVLVAVNGRRLIATSDYGNQGNEIRLYAPQMLAKQPQTSAEGVLVAKFLCGPFNQNLHWDAEAGKIVCVQNVTAGRGWRLQTLSPSLAELLNQIEASEPSEQLIDLSASPNLVFTPSTELEGYCRLPNGKSLFVTAHRQNNVVIADIDDPLQPID